MKTWDNDPLLQNHHYILGQTFKQQFNWICENYDRQQAHYP
ncbi:MAG: hypothetical protein WC748_10500 [Legionellales bacterium]